jgi:hypothetical protein
MSHKKAQKAQNVFQRLTASVLIFILCFLCLFVAEIGFL